MLVLARKIGEEIIIGNDIHVTILSIQGGKVRVGITAPRDVTVDRQEICELKQAWFGQINEPIDPFCYY